MAKTPGQGIYENVSYPEYNAWDAMRSSVLVKGARSMAHLRAAELEPVPDTKALIGGRAFHSIILEPDRFSQDFAICDVPGPYNAGEGHKAWTALKKANPEKNCLTKVEAEEWRAIAASVHTHPQAHALLTRAKESGGTEVSLLWEDPDTGLMCKARLDLLICDAKPHLIVDAKSTRDARPHDFARSIANYFYHLQAGWYCRGYEVVTGERPAYGFIAAEKSPPYAVQCYQLKMSDVDWADWKCGEILARYALCKESRVFPAYLPEMAILETPAWAIEERD